MTHPGSLSSVDPIHPTPSPLPPSLSLHSVQTYAHIVSSRGGEGSSTDPIINLPPFSLVPTSEPPLRLFAKKVACSTTPWVAQTFRQLFYCEACSSDWKLCHTPDQDVTNPTHLPSPPPPPSKWTRPDPEPKRYYVQNNAFLHPFLRPEEAADAMDPWMTPWPHKSMPYISLRLPGSQDLTHKARSMLPLLHNNHIVCFLLSKTFIVSIFWRPSFVHDSRLERIHTYLNNTLRPALI